MTKTTAPSPHLERLVYATRRDSRLNARGHEILAAVERVLDLIDDLEDADFADQLEQELAAATPADAEFTLGCLGRLPEDCRGFRWAASTFADLVRDSVIPLADVDHDPTIRTPAAPAERKPR